jgi:hypothetical protein
MTEKISLTISKIPSILENVEFREFIDINTLDKLIASDVLLTNKWSDTDYFENEKAQLIAYRKKFKRGFVPVKYYLSKSGFGRVSPFKSLSLCSIRREIRHTLAVSRYIDIDISNAHPCILLQICQVNNLAAPYLSQYVSNREKIINDLMDLYKVSRSDVKNLFIRLMYCGTFDSWANKLSLLNVEPSSFIREFTIELNKLANIILNCNTELRTSIKKIKDKSHNELGSVLSYFLQEYERRILEVVYKHLSNHIGLDCVLCFDGLMIPKNKFYEDTLNNLNTIVKEFTGFDLTFIVKQMDEGYSEFLNSSQEKDEYATLKEEFEVNHFKTRKPFLFYEECNGEFNSYKQEEFIGLNRNVKFNKIDDNGKIKAVPFVPEWFEDKNIREYQKIDFYPYGSECPKNVFNLFNGYDIEKHSPTKDVDMTMFKEYFMALCANDSAIFSYLYHWLANIIKTPAKKSLTSIIIKSPQGCGKGHLADFMNAILGIKYVSRPQGTSTFTGRFNSSLANKLFIAIDEASAKDGFENIDKLKNLITEPTIEVEHKGKDVLAMNNFCRFIFFTNNDVVVKIPKDDRRYCLWTASDKYQNNTDFFSKLRATYLDDNDGLYAVYNWFMSAELDGYDFVKNRPITEDYKAIQAMSVPVIIDFFIDIYYKHNSLYDSEEEQQEDELILYKSSDLFSKFRKYCETTGIKIEPNITRFALDIKLYCKFVEKIKKPDAKYFKFNKNDIIPLVKQYSD